MTPTATAGSSRPAPHDLPCDDDHRVSHTTLPDGFAPKFSYSSDGLRNRRSLTTLTWSSTTFAWNSQFLVAAKDQKPSGCLTEIKVAAELVAKAISNRGGYAC